MAKVQVLVLDDEERLLEVLVDLLHAAGYTATGCSSARQALAELDELQPELIVLDMMMPGVDGFEFLARLRADERHAGIAVLINSALGVTLARAIEPRSAATLGVVGVLAKPVGTDEFIACVRAAIGPGASRAAG